MTVKNTLLFLSFLVNVFAFSQGNYPILKTNTDQLGMKKGEFYEDSSWFLDFSLRPDTYISNTIGERITFYSDIDSISFVIEENKIFDFVVLYKGDSAFTQVKYEPSKLSILKGAGAYNYEDDFLVPTFIYQNASDENLQALRVGFKLDSIAGNGNEISQILNLMHWIHNLIPHDGMHPNPTIKNAMSMISECKKEERGLNCRGLATVLNECYLAMGFKSRFLTCLPKDTLDTECHVINIVFSKELNKWIWVDPTHDAFVMDENGILLGPEEVRFRLINDLPLVLNPKANWNNQQPTLQDYHLMVYMAKNLYRFSCTVKSEFNIETNKRGKKIEYVELLPLDAYHQKPKKETYRKRGKGVTVITYKTNNPSVFWEH